MLLKTSKDNNQDPQDLVHFSTQGNDVWVEQTSTMRRLVTAQARIPLFLILFLYYVAEKIERQQSRPTRSSTFIKLYCTKRGFKRMPSGLHTSIYRNRSSVVSVLHRPDASFVSI